MPLLEKMHARAPERVSEELAKALDSMKRLRSQEEEEASRTASEMFISLSNATSAFLGHYFDALRSRTG
jgi:predicted Zn-dependent peptidase